MEMDWKNEFIDFQNQDKPIANVNFALRVYMYFFVEYLYYKCYLRLISTRLVRMSQRESRVK